MEEKYCDYIRLTYAKIFFVDSLVSGPIDIFKLGPFRPGTEGSRIRSALVWIPDDRKESLCNSKCIILREHQIRLFNNLPCACKVCQIEYHALGERYLGPSIVLRPMGQTSDQGRSEKIWQLLSMDASRPLK